MSTSEVVLMQIPVIQRMKQTDENGEEKETTRLVPELIAPKYIVRVSPTKNGIVIWFAHGAPYMESPLPYEKFIEELQNLRITDDQATTTESD